MPPSKTKAVSDDVLGGLAKRLTSLRELLAATPSHESGWLWAIQYEILAYLLHRYAGDAVPALDLPKSAPTEPVVVRGPAADPPQRYVSVPIGMGKAPRSGDAIRGRLAGIASQNLDRYLQQEQEAAAERHGDEQVIVDHIRWLIRLLEKVDRIKLPAPLPDSTDERISEQSLEEGRRLSTRHLKETIRRQLVALGALGPPPEEDLAELCDMLAQVADDEQPKPVAAIPLPPKVVLEYSREPKA